MRCAYFTLSCIALAFSVLPAKAAVDCDEINKIKKPSDSFVCQDPAPPKPSFSLIPSVWDAFVERSSPMFKNGTAGPVGTQGSSVSGPMFGLTAVFDPQQSGPSFLSNTSFSVSSYYGPWTTGTYSNAYYKTPLNIEDNNWSGHSTERRWDVEALWQQELFNYRDKGGTSLKAVAGVRYVGISSSVVGQDIFGDVLTYARSDNYYLGEAGLRLSAPFGEDADSWRIVSGGTFLYGPAHGQSQQLCGCGSTQTDSGIESGLGYDFFAGVTTKLSFIEQNVLKNLSATLRIHDRSLYTTEHGKTGVDHQFGPEASVTWQF
jgi:hypothetical protein